jgi:hypothetical protein
MLADCRAATELAEASLVVLLGDGRAATSVAFASSAVVLADTRPQHPRHLCEQVSRIRGIAQSVIALVLWPRDEPMPSTRLLPGACLSDRP